MTSVESIEACLVMLRRQGFWPRDISVLGESISIAGLEPIPSTPAEDAMEASEYRAHEENSKENLRLLGLR